MKDLPLISAMAAALVLSACAENAVVTSSNVDPISLAMAPEGATPGTCWGKTVDPAVVETKTHKILVQPAQLSEDGRVQAPPVYRTEDIQQVVRARKENWYEVPCAAQMTPEFVASLQRALEARGYYRGPISGEMDAPTRAAARRYERTEGSGNPEFTVETARQLGLIAVERPLSDEQAIDA